MAQRGAATSPLKAAGCQPALDCENQQVSLSGFDTGKRSVVEGAIDCLRANADLIELERVLGP